MELVEALIYNPGDPETISSFVKELYKYDRYQQIFLTKNDRFEKVHS